MTGIALNLIIFYLKEVIFLRLAKWLHKIVFQRGCFSPSRKKNYPPNYKQLFLFNLSPSQGIHTIKIAVKSTVQTVLLLLVFVFFNFCYFPYVGIAVVYLLAVFKPIQVVYYTPVCCVMFPRIATPPKKEDSTSARAVSRK